MTDVGDRPSSEASDGAVRRALSRGRVVRATLRAGATAAAVVALYFVAPLDAGTFGVSIIVKLLVGIGIFVGLMTWNVRGIVASDNPGLKAFESLFVAVPLFLVLFAATYFLISRADDSSFTEPLTRSDALYFTVTVFSTVGFGDISPKSEPTRLLVAAQMILDLVVLGMGVRIIAQAVQRGRERLDG